MEELNETVAQEAVDTELPLDKNIKLMSPTRMVVRRFFRSRLSIIGLVMVIGLFIPSITVKLILMAVYYTLCGWSIFRMLSRNTYRRYRENRRFLLLIDRFRDRQHRYFDCPSCRQSVRVPRGKGKIAITCPKCREKFVRKT